MKAAPILFMVRFFLALPFLLGVANPAGAEPHTVPPAPDYAMPDSWAAAGEGGGSAGIVAPGAARRRNFPADIFYIHPTTDRSMTRWNQPVADVQVNSWTDASVIARQAAIFNGCCRVFAPRYRQATVGAQRAGGKVREEAFALAYDDVRRAFRYYLEHYNKGRPFILVGHSQGAAHLEKLLDEEVGVGPVRDRLVAAYVVGITLPAAKFGQPGALAVCAKPDSTGCVVHWTSYLSSIDVGKTAGGAESYNRSVLPQGVDPQILCINPLTFDVSRSEAGRGSARGAVIGSPDDHPVGAIKRHAVSARCERGLLLVDPDPALKLEPLPGGSMHYHDLGLFYEDVRRNAILRVRAWLRAHGRR